MALLYADENFDRRVVERLRQSGHDVRTVQEAGWAGRPDPQVLADATAEGRAVLTFDHNDFARLHRQGTLHAGIISCTSDAPDALAARIARAIAATGVLAGQFLRVVRPSSP